MKLLLSILFVMTSLSSFAQIKGHCEVLYPGQYDQSGRACFGSYFGVAYKRYLESNNCYPSFEAALNRMGTLKACSKSGVKGHCHILTPGQTDQGGRSCMDGAWGVVSNGKLSRIDCYKSIDQAMSALSNKKSCL